MNFKGHRLFASALLSLVLVPGWHTTGLVAQQPGDFSIEQIMSSPFPSEMTAAPAGGRVAWVMNDQGARNVWVAEGPDFAGTRITDWSEDDGQTLSQLSWSSDGQTIFFVRGDGPNSRGELPNPLNDPSGTEQMIWSVGISGGAARKLTNGTSPRPAPAGQGLVFLRTGQIWWIDLDSKADAGDAAQPGPKPRRLVHARGNAGSLRWSPDGARLGFVSSRGDHSFIGVFSPGSNQLQYLDPSVDQDTNPVWSPDGSRIAFLRIPASTSRVIFGPQRSAWPWSIRVANPSSGSSEEIWIADSGRGSAFRSVVAPNQLLWTADNLIVFPWEKDGWTHLYSISASGGAERLLTPGEGDAEQVILSSDRQDVIFSSNLEDIDRRHLWTVPASGGTPQRVTEEGGSEWSPAPIQGGRALAMIRAGAKSPARPSIVTGESGASRFMAVSSFPVDFPEDRLVEPRQVIFASADGLPIHGQLFLPPNHDDGARRPALLYFHGGSRRQMLLGWHYSSYYHNCYAMNQFMASRGFVVMSVNYRSGIQYGMEFREALNYGAAGASEFNDVMGAGLYLRGRPDVDPDRIGLWGGSYGGYLTALGLARASELFAAGVDLHGVHDWNKTIRNFVPSYNPLEAADVASLAFKSSPMASIDTWRSPVLLVHGDDDRNVPFGESVRLAEALRKQGVHFEQLILPDEVHGFLLHRSWLEAFRAAERFLQRHIVDRASPSG